jgi:hypothetical protein
MTTDILHEIWRPIAGYERAYEVSNFGNVRSINKFVKGRAGSSRLIKERVLKSKPCGKGYRSVNLSVENAVSTKLVHGLVAKAFIGDRPLNHEINHIDGNKTNNHAKNLVYCTPSENMQHAVKTGLTNPVRGEKAVNAKLKEADIANIRNRVAAGESQLALSKEYGVHNTTIRNIYLNSSWSHVSPEYSCGKKPNPYSKGSSQHCAKLNEKDIPIIRQRLASGETGIAIAKDYGIRPSAISYIKSGKTWAHVL